MAILGLLATMLIVMLMRIAMPFGAVRTGRPTAQVTLSFRERMLLQRTNVYAIGTVLLLLAATGQSSPVIELLTLFAVFALLSLRVRYTLTTDGIGLNNVVFRPWAEFQSVEETRRGLRLVPRDGAGAFTLHVLGVHRAAALQALHLPLSRPAPPPRAVRVKGQRR